MQKVVQNVQYPHPTFARGTFLKLQLNYARSIGTNKIAVTEGVGCVTTVLKRRIFSALTFYISAPQGRIIYRLFTKQWKGNGRRFFSNRRHSLFRPLYGETEEEI